MTDNLKCSVNALHCTKFVFFLHVYIWFVPQSGSGLPGHVFSSRGYFFDNPRRYDSDDDLAWSVMPQNIQARYNLILQILVTK